MGGGATFTCGASCLTSVGRVVLGQVLCGAICLGASCLWGELSIIQGKDGGCDVSPFVIAPSFTFVYILCLISAGQRTPA